MVDAEACKFCGGPVPPRRKAVGRPKHFCSGDCSRAAGRVAELEKLLPDIGARTTAPARERIRERLAWLLAQLPDEESR